MSLLTTQTVLTDRGKVPAILRLQLTGADPGFPVGGGADPRGGAPTYDFVKFSKKLHEIEKNLGRRGGRAPGAPPLNPPLVESKRQRQPQRSLSTNHQIFKGFCVL